MDMMYALAFSFLALGIVLAEPAVDEVKGDVFHTELHKHGDEQEITILDKNGKAVGSVDVFEDEGYQIDKPIEGEEHLCLLRKIDEVEEEVNSTDVCYKRRAVSYEEATGLNMSRILDHCGNRSIYLLEPQDCDRMYHTETGINRQKRSWPKGNYCCYYKQYRSVRCVRQRVTNRCCARIFFCIWRCRECVSYRIRYITQLICHYG